MITCKQATELVSEAMERDLTPQEWVRLKIHLFICEFCEQYRKQLMVLRNALRHIFGDAGDEHLRGESLRAEIKQHIQRKLDNW